MNAHDYDVPMGLSGGKVFVTKGTTDTLVLDMFGLYMVDHVLPLL